MELDPEGLEAARKVLGDNANVFNARETAALVIRAYEAHRSAVGASGQNRISPDGLKAAVYAHDANVPYAIMAAAGDISVARMMAALTAYFAAASPPPPAAPQAETAGKGEGNG